MTELTQGECHPCLIKVNTSCQRKRDIPLIFKNSESLYEVHNQEYHWLLVLMANGGRRWYHSLLNLVIIIIDAFLTILGWFRLTWCINLRRKSQNEILVHTVLFICLKPMKLSTKSSQWLRNLHSARTLYRFYFNTFLYS